MYLSCLSVLPSAISVEVHRWLSLDAKRFSCNLRSQAQPRQVADDTCQPHHALTSPLQKRSSKDPELLLGHDAQMCMSKIKLFSVGGLIYFGDLLNLWIPEKKPCHENQKDRKSHTKQLEIAQSRRLSHQQSQSLLCQQ